MTPTITFVDSYAAICTALVIGIALGWLAGGLANSYGRNSARAAWIAFAFWMLLSFGVSPLVHSMVVAP